MCDEAVELTPSVAFWMASSERCRAGLIVENWDGELRWNVTENIVGELREATRGSSKPRDDAKAITDNRDGWLERLLKVPVEPRECMAGNISKYGQRNL